MADAMRCAQRKRQGRVELDLEDLNASAAPRHKSTSHNAQADPSEAMMVLKPYL